MSARIIRDMKKVDVRGSEYDVKYFGIYIKGGRVLLPTLVNELEFFKIEA